MAQTTARPVIPPDVFLEPMHEFLTHIAKRIVVVGSVARTIHESNFRLPKDIDLLCDLDSAPGRKYIDAAIKHYGLTFESPFIASWTFRDYGWMVEIIGIHHGPFYRQVRRKAEMITIGGVLLHVARAEDAPKERPITLSKKQP